MSAEELFKGLPNGFLKKMYRDQKRALKAMGVTIPSRDLFNGKLSLWRKVILLDWLLREALSGADGFRAH